MCGRYVLVQKIEVIERRFNVKWPEGFDYNPNYNAAPGQMMPVITDDKPEIIQFFRFGMVPFFAKKDIYLINARAEGDSNLENRADYIGAKGIIKKPAFRKPIRSQRCLIPADCFIEGTSNEKLAKPYLVYLKNKIRPFAFAGLWDKWNNPETGDEIFSFCIITTVANELMQQLPHHRSPVILKQGDEKKWLNKKRELSLITSVLKPYPSALMNAYPISPVIRNPKANEKELLNPIGERVFSEEKILVKEKSKLQGMGNRKRRAGDSLEDRLQTGTGYF